jgi:cytochrome bd-type quinol oxidase subunit 2
MWIGGANELVVDENFFVAVTQECVRDREQRVNYRNLLIALLVVEFAVLIANGLQLKANFSKEMAVWAWIVVTIVRFVCFGGAMIRIKNESRSGSLLLFGASLTFSLVVFGLLFNHSSEGILLVIVHVLITLVAHLLKSVMSPLWFCPTFA